MWGVMMSWLSASICDQKDSSSIDANMNITTETRAADLGRPSAGTTSNA